MGGGGRAFVLVSRPAWLLASRIKVDMITHFLVPPLFEFIKRSLDEERC